MTINKFKGTVALFALCGTISRGQLLWNGDTIKISAKPGDATVRAQFLFKNSSDHAVHILECRPSCDCVKVEWPAKPLAPRETGSLEINYRIHSNMAFQKQNIEVIFEKESGVASAVEQNASKTLYVEVAIQQSALVVPNSLFWKLEDVGVEKSFEVCPQNGLRVIRVDVESNSSPSFNYATRSEGNGKYILNVTFRGSKTMIVQNFEMLIFLSDDSIIRCTVTGVVMP